MTRGVRTMAIGVLLLAGPWVSPAKERAGPWQEHVRQVDEALAARNVSAAVRAWHRAYGEALVSRSWEGLIEVAAARLRIGRASGTSREAMERARALYLHALFRARQQGSLDGVLAAAEGFARLGDSEVVERAIRIAQDVAARARDPEAVERLRAFVERWNGEFVERWMNSLADFGGP